MEPDKLKKLDQIPTSNKPWYTRTPFLGIMAFTAFIIVKILLHYLS